ncbi:ABC-type uncharacterized transport system auxiliary subunit [Clostridium punense]|uniref:ABC-type uncharacterized transport system auxiliary subunit n=2 Tax=Clostridium TaxID=1485 RepID=A0ABS4K8B5_9CLOT|nr:hypothetical protein [Clostridium punense]MBP2024028.1 ABC-type uncharacterized transport system auxiliary subunit [Clostridium punense]
MRNLRKYLIIITLISTTIFLSACGMMPKKNKDFEYIKQRGVMKVTIQSTRDKSYKFTVTDKQAIEDIYQILSSAKEVQEKTSLNADYILEIYEEPNKIIKFNYTAGLDKGNGANFYNEEKSYIVSNRLDNDIIKNFRNIRKPIDFEDVYYESLYRAIEQFNTGENKNKKIGVNLKGDMEAAKYQLSTDIMYFEDRLKKISNVENVKGEDLDGYDVVMKIKTEGYTDTKYKATVTFQGNPKEKPAVYYISNVYEQGSWKINITDKKPENF